MALPTSTGRRAVNSAGLSEGAGFRGGLRGGLGSSVSGPDSVGAASGRRGESQVVVNACGFCQLPLLGGTISSLFAPGGLGGAVSIPYTRGWAQAEAWLRRAPHRLSPSDWVQGGHVTHSEAILVLYVILFINIFY